MVEQKSARQIPEFITIVPLLLVLEDHGNGVMQEQTKLGNAPTRSTSW